MKKVTITKYQCEVCETKYETAKDALDCEKKCNCPHTGVKLLYGSAQSELTTYLTCAKCEYEIDRASYYCWDSPGFRAAKEVTKAKTSAGIRKAFAELKKVAL